MWLYCSSLHLHPIASTVFIQNTLSSFYFYFLCMSQRHDFSSTVPDDRLDTTNLFDTKPDNNAFPSLHTNGGLKYVFATLFVWSAFIPSMTWTPYKWNISTQFHYKHRKESQYICQQIQSEFILRFVYVCGQYVVCSQSGSYCIHIYNNLGE